MFLRHTIQKNKYGKRYKYYKIVSSCWDKNKKQSRQKVIYYLGKLSDNERKKIKMMLKIWNDKNDDLILTRVKDIVFDNSYQYLAVSVIFFYWDYWKFSSFFNSLPRDADREIYASSVINQQLKIKCILSF